jgi:hypothetical protein
VTHTTAWWSGTTSNEGNNWLWNLTGKVVLLKEFRSFFFSRTTNFTNKDITISAFIIKEDLKSIDEVSTVEWITTNTVNKSLT